MSFGKTVKARKEHQCTLCFNQIQKGEKYYFQRLTPWDHELNDGFSNYRAHDVCHTIWLEIGADCDWAFPPDKWVWGDITEAYCQGCGEVRFNCKCQDLCDTCEEPISECRECEHYQEPEQDHREKYGAAKRLKI